MILRLITIGRAVSQYQYIRSLSYQKRISAVIMKSKAAVVLVTLLLAITQAVYGDHPPPLGDHEVEDEASRVRTAMEAAEIVPDVVGQAPRHLIKVSKASSP